MLLLLAAAAALADDRYYPGEGDALVSYAEEARRGRVTGRTGRVLAGGARAADVAGVPGVAAVVELPGGVLRVVPAAGIDDLALARTLHERGDVAWALPDLRLAIRAADVPDDPYVAQEWHLENTGQSGVAGVDVNAAEAWARATGAGQIVAVLDSGVQADHPDLAVIPGHDYVDDDDDPSPGTDWDAGHGTCAAGVAAATGGNAYGVAGVAWGAEVYAIRMIGAGTSLEELYDAFVEAVDAGAGVLSNSWGFTEGCEEVPNYAIFRKMFKYAEDVGRGGLGSLVVFAAGNGNCDIERDGMLEHDSLIVVAAVESDDRRAGYSSYGAWVDLAAPTSLLTTDVVGGGFGSYADDDALVDGFNGTSASTPVVAGTVALMLEANPRITAAQVREVLCATATRVDVANAGYDADGWSPYYGCGRVDAGAAVEAVAGSAPAAPVPARVRTHVPEGRVALAWEAAADADGDVASYEVAWWRDGEDEAEAWTVATTETGTDLGDDVVAGETVHWRVRALDRWGAGPWSETVSFTVIDGEGVTVRAPPAPAACAAASGRGGGVAAGLVAAGVALSRRRAAARRGR